MVEYDISINDKLKIDALDNPKVQRCIDEAAELMKPKNVIVINDEKEDIKRIRKLALESEEEKNLDTEGHTIHFDGWYSNKNHDQARDKKHTATLLPKGQKLSRGLNVVPREEGLREILGYMDGVMKAKTMIVRFFCLGPAHSEFSIPALQITDSSYVAHSEDLLYRTGYEVFLNMEEGEKNDFFYLWHSAGELNERGNTIHLDKRRIYIDHLAYRVFSVNNQYAGNSLGLKKLCLRLAIYKANKEDWLTEHMFIAGYSPKNKDRITYFTGAYPSACGRTINAMIPRSSLVGDDIAYLRKGKNGELRGVNIESGIFGIIRDVNPEDDPFIYNVLTTPRELIFTNVLINNGKPYWLGMEKQLPEEGENYAGHWKKGNIDENGQEIMPSHPNARYTIRINDLDNADPHLNDPQGVKIDGIFYGGRDSDTTVPVAESLSWEHGVFIGAIIESETTAATLGKTGVRKSCPMANMDFIIIPLGEYLTHHIEFGNNLKHTPRVYATNYFLKDEKGNYLNGILDKKIWVLWAEGRVNEEFDAIKTPIGNLPKYEDLLTLFERELGEEYTKKEYIRQFSIRTSKYLEKFNRMKKIYKDEEGMPQEFWDLMKNQCVQLEMLKEKYGDSISPLEFVKKVYSLQPNVPLA